MRKLPSIALVALLTLIPVSTASAKSKVDAFAAKYHLSGAWKGKDADKDGLKNGKEFKLGTDPRKADTDKDGLNDADELRSGNNPLKADTDRDGIKDGAEHAGVVTAFDGETLTLREFATGKKVKATLDTECTPALGEDDDATADDSSFDDGSSVDVTDYQLGGFFQAAGDDDDDVDLGDCADEDLAKGDVFQSAELEKDGAETFLLSYELA